MAWFVVSAWAGPVTVEVDGVTSAVGVVVCRWWSAPDAFPVDVARAAGTVRVPARAGRTECPLGDVEGRIAVAVFHDLDADDVLDVNLLQIPSEAYGFSAGAAPRFRAPTFDEAAVEVGAGASLPVVLR